MKRLYISSVLWAIVTAGVVYILPAFFSQGSVVYCNDQLPVKNQISCQTSSINVGNVQLMIARFELYVLSVAFGVSLLFTMRRVDKKNRIWIQIIVATGIYMGMVGVVGALWYRPAIAFISAGGMTLVPLKISFAYMAYYVFLPAVAVLLGYVGATVIFKRHTRIT